MKLSQRLNIPYQMAKKTLQATTQLAVRTVVEPLLTLKFSTNDRMIRYPRLAKDTFTDAFFASKRSGALQRGFTLCQICTTAFSHMFVVLMGGKSGMEIAPAIK